MAPLHKTMKVEKVDAELGIVIGYAIVSQRKNADGSWEDYYDLQGDHIPFGEVVKASADFMKNSRVAKEMHSGEQRGETVFAIPVDESIAKSLGWTIQQSGLVIGVALDADLIAKYKSGALTEYSLGGFATSEEIAA
jgi:putative serine protease XkdF